MLNNLANLDLKSQQLPGVRLVLTQLRFRKKNTDHFLENYKLRSVVQK